MANWFVRLLREAMHKDPYLLSGAPPIYAIGSFDESVTVLSQQVRALNLTHDLVEHLVLPTAAEPRKRIAVVGAGFTGLTFVAGLMAKSANVDVTIFEERDTLLPLQQGSDTRWLHPKIYDWPKQGSEATAAMLPLLNWTAARASDVVVQVLTEWAELARSPSSTQLKLFCNTRHLQISPCKNRPDRAQVEWVGESRSVSDGGILGNSSSVGLSQEFDYVVLAVGFGLERGHRVSYWRNETYGQPSLSQARATYLVSGQGDGAMIDLLRLRISQFRQDRILDELFPSESAIRKALEVLKSQAAPGGDGRLFEQFERLSSTPDMSAEWDQLTSALQQRLRRDTEAYLHLKADVRDIANLIAVNRRRMSFQNAFLIYLLYRCGGFYPTSEDEITLTRRLGIQHKHRVIRHGPDRLEQFSRILSPALQRKVQPRHLKQSADVRWPGGYFGFPGRLANAEAIDDANRVDWRKEYLPGPAAFAASALVGTIAGLLYNLRPSATHERLTLHRTLELNGEVLFQQMCDYAGRTGETPARSSAGRTFDGTLGTIGLALRTEKTVRSLQSATRDDLQTAMAQLKLRVGARRMEEQVGFLLAIPVLQPEDNFLGPSRVAAVLYIDSRSQDYWLNDDEVQQICQVLDNGIRAIGEPTWPFPRIRNVALSAKNRSSEPPNEVDAAVRHAIDVVKKVGSPVTREAFQFNFDTSDLTPRVAGRR